MKYLPVIAMLFIIGCRGTGRAHDAMSPDGDDTTANGIASSRHDTSYGVAPADTTPCVLTMSFGGDVMMGTNHPRNFLPPNDGKNLFDNVRSILLDADIAAVNLEGALRDLGTGTPKSCRDTTRCFTFGMPTAYANNLVDAGIDFVGIANNHSNDFGAEGLSSTMATLDNAGIGYAGIKGKCETFYIQRHGKRVGMAAFGFSSGNLSINDLDYMRKVLKELNDSADIVVVSFHNGAEGRNASHVTHSCETAFGENRGNPEAFAHAAIDAGADIVWGHGPHVVRAMELYKDRLIIYSLGNFVTPYRMSLSGISGHAPVVTVNVDATDGRFIDGHIHSFIQRPGIGPVADPSAAAAKRMSRLTAEDFPLTGLAISPDDGHIMRK